MIHDFTKGTSAIYFSSLITIDYNLEFNHYDLIQSELEYDEIGFSKKSKNNGFMRLGIFLPSYNNVRFRKNPALHISNCETTDDLSQRMRVSNSANNTFFSRDTKSDVNANLEICKKCIKHLRKKYDLKLGTNTFSNFVLPLEESEQKQTITDSNGYIINWQQVSYCLREIRNFKCEKCGFTATKEEEYKFLHTHHINKVKSNNFRSNLQCLCVKCHSEVDQHHIDRFKLVGLTQLLEFIEYKNSL